MSGVATATNEQLALLSNFVVNMRAQISQCAILMSRMNALSAYWTSVISPIIGTPAGTTIADNTGLAGAVPLTDTQVAALIADIQAILTQYYTPAAQELYAQVAGPTNVTG